MTPQIYSRLLPVLQVLGLLINYSLRVLFLIAARAAHFWMLFSFLSVLILRSGAHAQEYRN